MKKKIIKNISDFISLLEDAKKEYGDVEVDNLYIFKNEKNQLHEYFNDIRYDAEKNRISLVIDKTSNKRKLKRVDFSELSKAGTGFTKREAYKGKKVAV